MTKNSKTVVLASILGAILLIVLITTPIALTILKQKHHDEIERIIGDRNGIVLHIDKVKLEESPFLESSSGNVIYKVEYEVDGIKQVAWYRGLKTVNDIHYAGAKDEEEKWIFE